MRVIGICEVMNLKAKEKAGQRIVTLKDIALIAARRGLLRLYMVLLKLFLEFAPGISGSSAFTMGRWHVHGSSKSQRNEILEKRQVRNGVLSKYVWNLSWIPSGSSTFFDASQ
jgi:hypothetical protein